MSGPRLLVLLAALPLACGDSSSDSSFSDSASQPSAAATDTTAQATTDTLVPTSDPTSDPTSVDTTAASASATTTTADPTTSTTTTTTSDTTGPVDPGTTTSDDTTTTTTTTTAPDDTTGDDTNNCPEGTQGCPCGPNNTCDMGLQCQAGLCVHVPACGDGVVEGNEACDLGGQNSNTGACKLDCTKQTCGDGYTGPGEACDDGNGVNGDGCETNCTKSPLAMDNCGQPADGLWIQIDYDDAFSPTNPDWAYGGWTEAQWAPQGENWPYINALGGVVMNEDRGNIGTVASLDGTNKAIRVFIGLGGLIDYEYATACVEGRSYDTGSSVTFRVENALNDCGGQGMMSNDWVTLHPTNVDIGANCFIPGNDFQAIEIRPISGSGSLSLKRMRVTFHGAVY